MHTVDTVYTAAVVYPGAAVFAAVCVSVVHDEGIKKYLDMFFTAILITFVYNNTVRALLLGISCFECLPGGKSPRRIASLAAEGRPRQAFAFEQRR